VVLADDLPRCLYRLGPAAREENLLDAGGCQTGETLRQFDGRWMSGRPARVEGELRHLFGGCLSHLGAVRVPDLTTEQRRKAVDIATAFRVEDVRAFPSLEYQQLRTVWAEGTVPREMKEEVLIGRPLKTFVTQLHRVVTTFLRV
jgi:hypothetical protein